MARELPTIPHADVPQHGLIKGGLLDGWSYGLVDLEVAGDAVHLVTESTTWHSVGERLPEEK